MTIQRTTNLSEEHLKFGLAFWGYIVGGNLEFYFPELFFVASMWLVLSRFEECLVLCSYIKGTSWFSIDIYLFFCDCHIVFHILFFCSVLSKFQLFLLRSSPFNLSSLAYVQGLAVFHGFCILWSFVSLIICNSAWPVQCEIRITLNTIGLWNPFLIYAPIMTICLNVPLWGLLFFPIIWGAFVADICVWGKSKVAIPSRPPAPRLSGHTNLHSPPPAHPPQMYICSSIAQTKHEVLC